MSTEMLLVELGTEELPPTALKSLGLAFRDGIVAGLASRELEHGQVRWFATPRRLAVQIGDQRIGADRRVNRVLRRRQLSLTLLESVSHICEHCDGRGVQLKEELLDV